MSIIAEEKLTQYLLVPRRFDDKSRFLAQGGFSIQEPHVLEMALRELASSVEAVSDGENEYGEFLRQEGRLKGPNGRGLNVALIWIKWRLDGSVRFVTLKPVRERFR